MSPELATALIAFAAVVAIFAIGWMIHRSEPLGTTADEWRIEREAEFKAYVAREIDKARRGAANADAWAVALVSEWDARCRRG